MNRIERGWDSVEDVIIGALAGIALLMICYEVITRYFAPSMLTDWTSEVVIYLTVWAMLLAGGQLVTGARHIRADLVLRKLPEGIQRVLEFCNLLVGLLYCGLVAKFGYDVVKFAQMLDERSESSIQFPLWIFYVAVPVGFGLMCVRYALRLYRYLFHFDRAMLASEDYGDERLERSQT